jgi:hypothetical protein
MNYKIIKLSNGDEIIADVKHNDDHIVVENPMLFLYSTMSDMNGISVDVTFLKDWLSNSDVKTTTVKNDRIVIMTDASEKCCKIYEQQKTSQEKKDETSEFTAEEFLAQMDKMVSEIMENSVPEEFSSDEKFDNYEAFLESEEKRYNQRKRKKKRKKESDMSNMIPKELRDRPMIYLNMIIPPEAIMNLISSGILDADVIQKIIDETKKKNNFTGDEKTRKDFGNKLSDWNPDPQSDDYM